MTRIYDWHGIVDGSSISTDVQEPQRVRWQRSRPSEIAWFTDSQLGEALTAQAPIKVAILFEPPEMRTDHYDFVENAPGLFDAVFTWRDDWALPHPRKLRYLFGGTRIPYEGRGLHPKNLDVSIIASPKRRLEGHAMRHDVIARCPGLTAYGADYEPLPDGGFDKRPALAPYRATVVIQPCRRDWWFTEALIDAFLMGAVPIYWGCPSIGDFFDVRGIVQCETVDDVVAAVKAVQAGAYDPAENRPVARAVRDNYLIAQIYPCAEDELIRLYPDLFEERPG